MRRIIDLTFPIHEGMTTFPVPWHPTVEVSILGRHGIERRETRKITLGTHTGTHCDAPLHFIPGGNTVDQIPLDTLIGPAFLVDLSQTPPGNEVSTRTLSSKIGERRPERVILRFDWDAKWGSANYYTDHPFLSTAAAEWLVGMGVKLVAMDTPMPDNPKNGKGSQTDSPNHKIFLKSGTIIVEYLCNLNKIRNQEVELIALPLKIKGGDGSPLRCVAIENF